MNSIQKLPETSPEQIQAYFKELENHNAVRARTSRKERSRKLSALAKAIMRNRKAMQEALYLDFKKPAAETDMIEVYPIIHEIRHARKNLRDWMRPQKVPIALPFLGSKAYIYPEPKGVVLILSPWNFPFNLTLIPLISAVAAGNVVMIKPSEQVPHAARMIEKIVSEVFTPEEVVVVQGGPKTAETLLQLPFNHIFFTGSERVGKIVMKNAADHLTSVTLELGGKTPTIVDATAHLRQAARRIVAAKFSNAGQICISPDHVWVHDQIYDRFLQEVQQAIQDMFGINQEESPSYARIVNEQQWNRLGTWVENAIDQGAGKAFGGKKSNGDRYLQPTIVTDVPGQSELAQREIFGPVLPVHRFAGIDEVIDAINAGPKPLALYLYSNNRSIQDRILSETSSGGVCINHNALHFYNSHLPFGGINHSGIGNSHGRYGFLEFTNQKAVYDQAFRYSMIDLVFPPAKKWKDRLIDLVIQWF